MKLYTENTAEQGGKTEEIGIPLAKQDRRILLGATLRLLSRRFSCGQTISQNELIRTASLADDAAEQAA